MIFIPGNVPSLKNSKVKTSRGVFASSTVRKYLQQLGVQRYSVSKKWVQDYKTRPNKFKAFKAEWDKMRENKEYPLKVGFYFKRGTAHRFDFHNAVQIIADLLVAHDFIEDDDMTCFLPIPIKINGKWYEIDRDNPGVLIKIY